MVQPCSQTIFYLPWLYHGVGVEPRFICYNTITYEPWWYRGMTTIVEPWYNGRFRRGIPILVNFDRSPEFDEWLSKSESRIIICLLTCPMITGTKFWSRSNESRTTDKSFETEVDTQTNGRRQHSQHNSSTNLCSQRSWNPGCYCFVSSVSVWQLELPSQPRCLYFPTFSVWSSTWLYWKFRQAAWRHI